MLRYVCPHTHWSHQSRRHWATTLEITIPAFWIHYNRSKRNSVTTRIQPRQWMPRRYEAYPLWIIHCFTPRLGSYLLHCGIIPRVRFWGDELLAFWFAQDPEHFVPRGRACLFNQTTCQFLIYIEHHVTVRSTGPILVLRACLRPFNILCVLLSFTPDK